MNIELPADAVQFVEGLVASGQYKSSNEAVAEGVRLLMSRQQLRTEIQKGVDELDDEQCAAGAVERRAQGLRLFHGAPRAKGGLPRQPGE